MKTRNLFTEAVNKFQEINLNAFEMQWENS